MCRGYYWIPCATWADHSYLLLLQQRRRCPALPSPVSINNSIFYNLLWCLCRRDSWIYCATGADHSDLLLLPGA